jgi:DNA uptake protein ComE-like DNA-binding protein
MERAVPFHGNISAVDQTAKTFTIAGKEKARVFKVTDKTLLTKAGVPAAMKDVQANDEVRGTYMKAADGSLDARIVKLGPMTEAEKAASPKKSKKKTKPEASTPAASTSAAPSAPPVP